MMERNKVKGIFLIVLAFLLLSACSEEKDLNDGYEDRVIFTSELDSYGSDGMSYIDNGTFMAHFVDSGNGTDVTVCFRPDCDHNEDDCPGNLGYCSDFLFFTDRNEYFTSHPGADGDVSYGVHDICLMKADRGGTNRKEIFTIRDGQQGLAAAYRDGYLAYAYRESDKPERTAYKLNEELDEYRTGLYLFDLENEKAVQVEYLEAVDTSISTVNIEDGILYYLVSYFDRKMDFDFGGEVDWNEVVEFREKYAHQQLYSYEIATSEKKLLWEGTGESVSLYGDGYLIKDAGKEDEILYIMTEGNLFSPLNGEALTELMGRPGRTGLYLNGSDLFFICDGKLSVYDTITGNVSEHGRLSEGDCELRILAVVGGKVYYSEYTQTLFEIMCVPLDDFMECDLSGAVQMR